MVKIEKVVRTPKVNELFLLIYPLNFTFLIMGGKKAFEEAVGLMKILSKSLKTRQLILTVEYIERGFTYYCA